MREHPLGNFENLRRSVCGYHLIKKILKSRNELDGELDHFRTALSVREI